jgi:hypothetical protein
VAGTGEGKTTLVDWLIDQNINGELAPGFIRGGKPLANLFAVKFLFGFEYTF